MSKISETRRIIGLAVAVAILTTTSTLLTNRYYPLFPITSEQARDALAEKFPEVRDVPIVEHEDYVEIGKFHCNLSEKQWSYYQGAEISVGDIYGTFERKYLWKWRAVETWRVVCVHRKG